MGKRSKKARGLRDVQRMLAAPATATVDAWVDAIVRTNPTAQDLRDELARERYRLKSSLQSRLIREHADALALRPDEGGSWVLWPRFGGRDACHVVLDELDDDARAWARAQIDAGALEEWEAGRSAPAPGPSRDAPRDAGGDAGALARGRAALEAYDYDQALACFEEALDHKKERAAAALALIDTLVDHLGQYEDALGFEERLPAEATDDPRIRGRLGVAAARIGASGEARRWIKGLRDERAATALAELVRAALRSGATEDAELRLGELRELDAAHPDVAALERELTQARDAHRRAEEAELQASLQRGGEDVEPLARRLLERWPNSRLARQTLEQIEAEKTRARADEAARRAEAERAAGRARAALEHLEIAAALDPERYGADLEILRAEAAQEAWREAEAAVLTAAATGDPEALASAVLELDAAHRARMPGPGWTISEDARWLVEQAVAAAAHRKAPRKVELLRGLVDLFAARARIADEDYDAAEARLAPQERRLSYLAGFDALHAAIRKARAASRAKEVDEALAAARPAVARADSGALAAALEVLRRGSLDPSTRAEVDALQDELRQLEEHERLWQHGEEHEDLFERRRALEQLLEARVRYPWRPGGRDDRAQIERALLQVRRRIDEAWRVRRFELPGGSTTLHFDVSGMDEAPQLWTTPEGRLFVVEQWGPAVTILELGGDPLVVRRGDADRGPRQLRCLEVLSGPSPRRRRSTVGVVREGPGARARRREPRARPRLPDARRAEPGADRDPLRLRRRPVRLDRSGRPAHLRRGPRAPAHPP